MNKEYRLASWPELSPAHHRTAYRRMLSEMSQRYVSMSQLISASGLRRLEVKQFLETLESANKLMVRETCQKALKSSRWGMLRSVGNWFRRASPEASVSQLR